MVPTERFGNWCPMAILEFQGFTPYGCFTHLRCLFHCFAVSRFHNSSHITHNFSHVTHNPKSKPRLCLFAFIPGSPEQTKTTSVCYGEKRRYELLSMIEQSDIIRAISLPNAPLPNAKYRIIGNVRSYFLSFWAIEQICWWAEWILIILDSCPADKLHA